MHSLVVGKKTMNIKSARKGMPHPQPPSPSPNLWLADAF